ncbi:MAG: elongation factor 1-beta [Candidatus Woesearchaeota archaeon]
MANVVVTMKLMPESPETDLESLSARAEEVISSVGEVGKKEFEPVAFGLKAILLSFVMDESKGSTEDIEKKISDFEEVASVEIIDVRRAMG